MWRMLSEDEFILSFLDTGSPRESGEEAKEYVEGEAPAGVDQCS